MMASNFIIQCYKTKWRGFTIVEILVVVAILVLLSSLVFSVFSRAKNASQRAVCASDLHQIGLALDMYIRDANGRFPSFDIHRYENCSWAEQIYPYTRSTAVFRCPNFEFGEFRPGCPASEETGDDVFPYNTWDGSYNLNYLVGRAGSRASYIRNQSATILMCDGTGGGENYGVEDPTQLTNPRDFSILGNRHNYGSNIYFADGHVKWMKYEALLDVNIWKPQ